ncbi:MAG: DUF4199 domain-containing protein [Bacteroidales bacterium]|nr:DUF4199 domain-containing protein [Bacteroidales bacterium]
MRPAMTAGAVTGCLMLFSSLLPFAQIISLCVFCGGIYYGTGLYRKHLGSVHFGRLFGGGVLTAFFSSVIIAFAVYILVKAVNPSLLGKYLTAAEQMLKSSELPGETVSRTMEQFRYLISPGFLSFAVIISYTLTGVLAALICSLFHVRLNAPTRS